jgi:hypothetical protein
MNEPFTGSATTEYGFGHGTPTTTHLVPSFILIRTSVGANSHAFLRNFSILHLNSGFSISGSGAVSFTPDAIGFASFFLSIERAGSSVETFLQAPKSSNKLLRSRCGLSQ